MAISNKRRSNPEARMELREHLIELRNRIMKASLGILMASVVGWFLYDPVFTALSKPMIDVARESSRTVEVNFTGVASAFDLKLRISAFLGVLIASPIWIYQLWAFITPGLTKKERRYALAFMLTAVPLFLAGAALAFAAMENFVKFFIDFTPNTAANVISVEVYLDFVMRMILSFGFSFLLPVILVALNMMRILPGRLILKAWRWVVVASFAFAAIATPTPDVTSMFILAIPLLVLFGVAIGVALLNDRRRARREAIDQAVFERDAAAAPLNEPEAIDAPNPVTDSD